MPSRPERTAGRRAAATVVLALGLAIVPASARTQATSATAGPLTAATVEAAASAVRADPDLGGVSRERTWRFKRSDAKPAANVSTAPWLRDLARWLAEGGRVIVWLLGAAALAAVVVTARRWLLVHGDSLRATGSRLPSHVRELDIRPESLPADIGAAVRALWLAGERRAALSLLYRGALSRLVHSYGVAIGDASTEGDCIRLARGALPAAPADFVAALVQAWQVAVYGDRVLASERVLRLCDDFDRQLPATPAAMARP